MSRPKEIQLENQLIDRLRGKITLLQPMDEKEAIIVHTLEDIHLSSDGARYQEIFASFSDESKRKDFIRRFLSYGVIEDLLCDQHVEDIIINSTNLIFIHHAEKGFIPTRCRFTDVLELDLFVRKLILFSGRNESKKIINFISVVSSNIIHN